MAASGVALVVLIAIFGWLVFGRYVLNDTPTWVEQLSLLLVVWITFLGAAVGVHRGTHLSVDFIREGLPAPLRAASRIASDLLLLIFGGLMTWHGTLLAMKGAGRAVPMLGVTEAWRSAPLALAGALIAIFSVARLVRVFRRSLRGGSRGVRRS